MRMCRSIIRQYLFSNGIEFKMGKARGIRLNIQDMMDDYWLPCCEDALDSALVLGFVVIEVVGGPLQRPCSTPSGHLQHWF